MKNWKKLKENQELWKIHDVREAVIDVIRVFFKRQDFREGFTPILVPVPSAESNLEVFETELRSLKGDKRRGFLIMSPEYSLKKLMAAGSGNIFEITKCFRNEEEVSESHNPEFTMLEWYRIGTDYKTIMEDMESLFTEIAVKLDAQTELKKWKYQGEEYDLSTPWTRISVAEAFEKYAGIDIESLLDKEKLFFKALEKGYMVDEKSTWEQIFYQIFFNEIEPRLKDSHRPIFVYDYPSSQAALSRRKASDPRFAERFEIFLAGLELGNCFSELTDSTEQKSRFEQEMILRKERGKTSYPIDTELIEALESGIPESAGIAVGVDRLVMLFSNCASISETMYFPANEIFEL
jgi:lysyl-tRNA synthetase class 2